jgi:hypothetical protein
MMIQKKKEGEASVKACAPKKSAYKRFRCTARHVEIAGGYLASDAEIMVTN